MTDLTNTIANLSYIRDQRRAAAGDAYDYPVEAISKLIHELGSMNETRPERKDALSNLMELRGFLAHNFGTYHWSVMKIGEVMDDIIVPPRTVDDRFNPVTEPAHERSEPINGAADYRTNPEKEEERPTDAYAIAAMVEIVSRVLAIYGANIRNEAVLHPNAEVAEALYAMAHAFDNADLAIRRGEDE